MGKRVRANGEGTVYRNKKGKWVAAISLDGDRRKVYYGSTRQEVSVKLNDAIRARRDGLPLPSERLTVSQYLTDWLASVEHSLKPRTFERYESVVRLHLTPRLGKVRLAKLAPHDLDKLYRELLAPRELPARRGGRHPKQLCSTTVLQVHRVLHRALDKAARIGLVPRNVATLVDAPRRRRHEVNALSPEQSKALLAAATGNRLEALYVVAVTTGMRRGELLGLRWRDVDLDAGVVQVRQTLHRVKKGPERGALVAHPPKNGKTRSIELAPSTVEALRRHQERQTVERLLLGDAWTSSGYVFTNEVGKPLEASNLVRRSFTPLLAAAGLPHFRFHDLRHTAATLMLMQGVHPKVVSEMLGHSSVSITLDLYSHVTPTMQRQAATAMEAFLNPQG